MYFDIAAFSNLFFFIIIFWFQNINIEHKHAIGIQY